MRCVVTLIVAGVVALVGCNSDASTSDPRVPYVDAAMESYDRAPAALKQVMRRSEARCLIDGMVEAIGVARLRSRGIMPKDLDRGAVPFAAVAAGLTAAERDQISRLLVGGECVKPVELAFRQLGSAGPFANLTPAQRRCYFSEVLASPGASETFVDSIIGTASLGALMTSVFSNPEAAQAILSTCGIQPGDLVAGSAPG